MSLLKTWSRFSKVKNGTEIKFRIQKVSTDKYEKAYDLLLKYFMPEEAISKASGIFKNKLALDEYNKLSKQLMQKDHHVDICFVDDGSNEEKVAGVSVMQIEKKTDPKLDIEKFKLQLDEVKTFFVSIEILENSYNVFEEQNVDCYFSGRGVVVHPEYRDLGIARELLNARVKSCKEYNVPLTAAWMATIGTQKAATKLGWETVKELNYEDIGREAGVTFEDTPTYCKLMLARVSL